MAVVLVYVSTASGTADDPSLQALALAHGLAAGAPVHALVVGDEAAAATLGAWGAGQVHVANHPALVAPAPDAHARILADLADRLGAAVVVGPGTEWGHTVVARCAARAGLPFAANCTAARLGSPTTVTRLRWGGSLSEESAVNADRAILTVAAHAVAAVRTGASASVEAFIPDLDDDDLAVRVVERVAAADAGISLAEAKVVVSGGRGVGSADGFGILEELAGLLNAAVGCSRVVTSAGWRPHSDQVGQTGTKVSPDLYIACGISGATQHIAGCKGAKALLAINADKEATIFAHADYAVIGDLHEIVPAITAELRKAKGR